VNSIPDRDVVLNVLRGQNGQWHVTVQGFSQPLASFQNLQAACAWAIDHARPTRGRVFVNEIPVIWGNSSDLRFPAVRGQMKSPYHDNVGLSVSAQAVLTSEADECNTDINAR
jgi:hypothetical protein